MTTNNGSLYIGDASQWQGAPDWDRVARSDVAAWWLKLGGADAGIYIDTQYQRNRAECLRLGLISGIYWYVDFGVPFAQQLDTIKKNYTPNSTDLGIALDFEEPSPLSVAETQLYVLDAMRQTRTAFGCIPTLYTSVNWINQYLIDANSPYPDELQLYPLWIAQYPWLSGTHAKEEALKLSDAWKPQLPAGVNAMTMWQYSSTNLIDGISAAGSLYVDMSVYFGGDLSPFHNYVWSLNPDLPNADLALPYDARKYDEGAHEADLFGEFPFSTNPRPAYRAIVANQSLNGLNGRSLIDIDEIYGFYANGTTVDVWFETYDAAFVGYEKRAVITPPDAPIQISVALYINGVATLQKI